jgi:hypothetical protein
LTPGLRVRSWLLRVVACGCVVLGAGCGDQPTGPSSSDQSGTYLSMTSSPGDVLGNGFTQRAGTADARFAYRRRRIVQSGLTFEVFEISIDALRSQPTASAIWGRSIVFTVPFGRAAGTFEATLPESGAPDQPNFWLNMHPEQQYSACGSRTTRWTITELSASRPDTIDRLVLKFEVRCARGTAPLVGEVSLADGTVQF